MNKLFVSVGIALSLLATPALAQTYYGTCASVSAGLTIGSRGASVTNLQNFLVAQNYPGGGSWMITGYYGQATAAAVRNFQSLRGLPQSGMVDAATASVMNSSCQGGSSYPYTYQQIPQTYPTYYSYPSYLSYYSNYYGGAPTITSLSQNTGSPGSSVTIYGVGFDAYNNTVNFDGTAIYNLPSSGSSITFTIPSNTPVLSSSLAGTQVTLSVQNSHGTSNAVQFTLFGYYPYGYGYPYNTYGNCNNNYPYNYNYNYNNCLPPQSATPYINYLNPNSGGVGTVVSVYGSGFSFNNNTVYFGSGVITNLYSPDGRSVSFTVPSTLSGYGSQPLTLSTYQVSVANSNGVRSNAVPFAVTSLNTYGGQPVITNETGPNTLSVGQQGTWNFLVNAPTNQYLTVSVSWGDQNYYGAQPTGQNQYFANQTISLTHTYYQAGTYTITFTVSNGSQSNTYTTTVSVVGSVSGQPSLSYLSPSSASVGQTVIIYGSGFTGNNTILFGQGAIQNVYSANGTSLTFTVPSYLSPYCASGVACPQYAIQVTPGTYNLSVMNGSGTSNALSLQIH